MPNQLLTTAGESLANISGAIVECVRREAQSGAPPEQLFEDCLTLEILRLRALGEEGLIGSLEAFSRPLTKLMRWGG